MLCAPLLCLYSVRAKVDSLRELGSLHSKHKPLRINEGRLQALAGVIYLKRVETTNDIMRGLFRRQLGLNKAINKDGAPHNRISVCDRHQSTECMVPGSLLSVCLSLSFFCLPPGCRHSRKTSRNLEEVPTRSLPAAFPELQEDRLPR